MNPDKIEKADSKTVTTRKTYPAEGHRQHLRERFAKSGLSGFQNYEILELLLTLAIPRRDVKPIAKQLLKKYSSFADVFDLSIEELTQIDGIGKNSALIFTLIRELCNHYLSECASVRVCEDRLAAIQRAMRMKIGNSSREYMMVVFVNNSMQVVDSIVYKGSMKEVSANLNEIASIAFKSSATGVFLAHNHPSGRMTPSLTDIKATETLALILRAIDIALHDHFIVSRSVVVSIKHFTNIKPDKK
jgi:DNA repair protein RadC